MTAPGTAWVVAEVVLDGEEDVDMDDACGQNSPTGYAKTGARGRRFFYYRFFTTGFSTTDGQPAGTSRIACPPPGASTILMVSVLFTVRFSITRSNRRSLR